MDLYEYYSKKFFIGQLPTEDFIKVLNHNHPFLYGDERGGDKILLFVKSGLTDEEYEKWNRYTKKCINCISKYYLKDGKAVKTPPTKNVYSRCDEVCKAFGISRSGPPGSCMTCHRKCVEQGKDLGITRK